MFLCHQGGCVRRLKPQIGGVLCIAPGKWEWEEMVFIQFELGEVD